jgi:hypothetical protein
MQEAVLMHLAPVSTVTTITYNMPIINILFSSYMFN